MQKFPQFAPLTLDDFAEFQKIAQPFYQYAHCAFSSVYCHQVLVSTLNNNIILCYMPPEYKPPPGLSLIGTTEINATLAQMFAFAKQQGYDYFLQAVPELSIAENFKQLQQQYEIEGGTDDYVYQIEEMLSLATSDKKKRYIINRHQRQGHTHQLTRLLPCTEVLKQFKAFHQNLAHSSVYEQQLLQNLEASLAHTEIHILSVYDQAQDLIAMSLFERKMPDYFTSFYGRHNGNYAGLGDFCKYLEAKAVQALGGKYLNLEDDCGLAGIAKFKLSWHPSLRSRKYTLTPNKKEA